MQGFASGLCSLQVKFNKDSLSAPSSLQARPPTSHLLTTNFRFCFTNPFSDFFLRVVV